MNAPKPRRLLTLAGHLLALAFGCAALYLLQHRLLKSHQVGGLFRRLPSLQMLDTVAYHAVALLRRILRRLRPGAVVPGDVLDDGL